MNDSQLPSPLNTQLLVDVRGAQIISSNSDDPSVLLPHHEESECRTGVISSSRETCALTPFPAPYSHFSHCT